MSAPPRGRGRARGRARGTPTNPQDVPRPGTSTDQVDEEMSRMQVSGPSSGIVQPQKKSPSPPHDISTVSIPQKSEGNGDDPQGKNVKIGHGPKGARGGVRGRTMRNAIIETKPPQLPTKKGTEGTPIMLKANFLPLENRTKWVLFHYDVKFSPELDNTKTKKTILRQGFNSLRIQGYLFDGSSLFSAKRLKDTIDMTIKDDADNVYYVNVRLVSEVSWTDWHTLQIFNIIMRRCLEAMGFSLLGRNYYNSKLKINVSEHNLELWPGFLTAMRQYERNIMLNLDLSFKVLRTDTMYHVYRKFPNDGNGRKDFTRQILGQIVLTYYNNKTYRIDDVDFRLSPQSTFRKRDGTEISYIEYYKNRYNIQIRNPEQPILVSRSKPREIRAGMPDLIMLIPELCVLTGLSDAQRENFQLMKSLSQHTCINPYGRLQKLKEFSEKLKCSKEAMQILREWDMQLADNVVQFQSRVLPMEKLYISQNRLINAGEFADWTHSLRSEELFSLPKFDRLAVICPERLKNAVVGFMKMLDKAASGMGIKFKSTKIFDMSGDHVQNYIRTIQTAANANPNMVLVVLPHNSADRYNAIKKVCYVDRALPCQVILSKSVNSKNAMSIATKLAIQMNCKIGGAPWAMSMPRQTMVVGYDVCRDKVNRKKAYAGMVATMDMNCAHYFSYAVQHENDEEISSSMGTFMLTAVKNFVEINKAPPVRILIYRDGVGDGDIPYVKEHEVEDVKRRLKETYYKDAPLHLAFIIVSKRINTKIFRAEPVGQKRDMNPPPGTVVDDVITWPERYDFYLVSQCVRQGTVCPTSYNIIEDTLGVGPDRIQQFTYKLTHMYFNWSGTIRVPAPCQYAHKLAFMTAQVLTRPADPGLDQTLYYL